MPALTSRKRRAQFEAEEHDSSSSVSPEPATQRRRASASAENDDAYGSDTGGPPDTPTHEPVKKLIRLALACEYLRKPLRRADISEKVLAASQSRQFKRVFDDAQTQLRSVFGMELIELPARERVTVREKRAQKAAASRPAPSWVLRSTLPSEFHDPAIMPPGKAPTSEEEGTYTGIYTVLVSLVMLSGGSLPEAKLERYLRRLGMEDQTPVGGYGKSEMLLKRMEREGYLTKVKEVATAGEEDVSWHVGPRGKVEVGNDGVKGLASAVHGEMDEEEEKELGRRIARSLGIGERERAPEKRDGEAGREKEKAKKRGRKRKDEQDDDEEEEDDEED